MKKLIFLLNISLLFSIWMGCSSSDQAQKDAEERQRLRDAREKPDIPDSVYFPLKEKIDFAANSLSEADSLVKSANENLSVSNDILTVVDSIRIQAQFAIAGKNISKAKSLLKTADSLLALTDKRLENADQSVERVSSLRRDSDKLQVKSITIVNKVEATVKTVANYAKRRLIVPGEAWDFDKAPVVTTDKRINPVLAFTDKSYSSGKEFEFRTVVKDSMIFDFRIEKDWIGSEKFAGKVISYNSPDDKIIITMNNFNAQFDSLTYWTAVYEASAYGKNQLAKADQRFPADRLNSLGAEQSYVARYHVEAQEIAAVFLQKGNRVVSVFVEYPNGSLSWEESDLINQFLNSIKFR